MVFITLSASLIQKGKGLLMKHMSMMFSVFLRSEKCGLKSDKEVAKRTKRTSSWDSGPHSLSAVHFLYSLFTRDIPEVNPVGMAAQKSHKRLTL